MLKKFDDFLIDGVFQRIVNITGIKPFVLSYYLWGVTMAWSAAIVLMLHNYFLILFTVACLLNMFQCDMLAGLKIEANPLRHDKIHFLSRNFVFLLMILGFVWFTVPLIFLPNALMGLPWVAATYVACCSVPPPRKVKEKKIFGKEIFQT